MNKKVQSKHYEKMFHCFRYRIEQMLEEGYSVQPITKEDRETKRKMMEIFHALQARAPIDEWDYDPEGPPICLESIVEEFNCEPEE